VSGPEIVAVNGGSATRLSRATAGRGDIVSVRAGVAGTLAPDPSRDAEADAARDGAGVDGAATAPHAASIPRLATNISSRGITPRE
jgi:hypothetical protein